MLLGMRIGQKAFARSNPEDFRLLVLNLLMVISDLSVARALFDLHTQCWTVYGRCGLTGRHFLLWDLTHNRCIPTHTPCKIFDHGPTSSRRDVETAATTQRA